MTDRPTEPVEESERTIGALELDYATLAALEAAFPSLGDLEGDTLA